MLVKTRSLDPQVPRLSAWKALLVWLLLSVITVVSPWGLLLLAAFVVSPTTPWQPIRDVLFWVGSVMSTLSWLLSLFFAFPAVRNWTSRKYPLGVFVAILTTLVAVLAFLQIFWFLLMILNPDHFGD
jgi:hypothetical protein